MAETGADLSLRDALAAALEANRQLVELTGKLREENARLREDNARLLARVAERDAELDRVRADLAVLQRMLFGRSSERSRPGPAGGAEAGGAEAGGAEVGGDGGRGNGQGVKRGPGARAGRRDYSHLPRFEVFWDFPGGGYGCPECGEPFTLLGEHVSGQQLDWQVIVRVVAHCRRRYRRACGCRVPATVMAPGPPKAGPERSRRRGNPKWLGSADQIADTRDFLHFELESGRETWGCGRPAGLTRPNQLRRRAM